MASRYPDHDFSRNDGDDAAGIPDRLIHRPRRPLPALAAAFAIGIVIAAYASLPPVASMAAAALCALVALPVAGHRRGSCLVLLAVVLTGCTFYTARYGGASSPDFRSLMYRPQENAAVAGRVISHPEPSLADYRGRPGSQCILAVETFQHGTNLVESGGRLRVIIYHGNSVTNSVAYGNRIHIRGTLKRDDRPAIVRGGLSGTLTATDNDMVVIDTNAGNAFVKWCYASREAASRRLEWGMDSESPSVALTKALLLGYRRDVPTQVHDAFARTGTLHILALSGMHVGILILLLGMLLKAAGIPRTRWAFFVIPFLVIYTVATGAAASTVRAAVMAGVYFASFLFRRRSDTPSTLALAALLILAADPLQLFDYGFILSFVTVGGIIALYPVMSERLSGRSGSDQTPDPEAAWLVAASSLRRRIVDLFSISAAAWLASLPLIATIFHLVSPAALLVNIILVPLATIILLVACVSLGLGAFSMVLASWANHVNALFCRALLDLVAYTSHIPGSHVYVRAWPLYLVLLWYVVLVVWVAGKGRIRWAAAAALSAMVVFSAFERKLSTSVHAEVISGGNSCILVVDGPRDHATLIDAGSKYRYRDVVDQLRSRGISRLDRIILTRATTDAYGSLDRLIETFAVGDLIIPEPPRGQRAYHESRARWEWRLGPSRLTSWNEVRLIRGAGGLLIEFLYPPAGNQYRSAGQSALILRISRGTSSLLFVGRAGPEVESAALTLPRDWNSEILVAGDCRSYDGMSTEWLDAVRPDVIVINSKPFDHLPRGPSGLLNRVQSLPSARVVDMKNTEAAAFRF